MRIQREWIEKLIFRSFGGRRFTQDSPILPDVWIRYATAERDRPIDLLLTPQRRASAARLAEALIARLGATGRERRSAGYESHETAYNQTTAVSRLTFPELIRCALPLSEWWKDYVTTSGREGKPVDLRRPATRKALAWGVEWMAEADLKGAPGPAPFGTSARWTPPLELLWLVRLAGTIQLARQGPEAADELEEPTGYREFLRSTPSEKVVDAFCDLFEGKVPPPPDPLLFLVSLNREASASISGSVLAVKADAARRLFNLSAARIHWAILDSGIDARHPAFQTPGSKPEGPDSPNCRVRATYDFTRIRFLVAPDFAEVRRLIQALQDAMSGTAKQDEATARRMEKDLEFFRRIDTDRRAALRRAQDLTQGLAGGRSVDWAELEPFLLVPHENGLYEPPPHDHGTHVAGILGASGLEPDGEPGEFAGVCPDILLYDFRVLDHLGMGSEFSVMAGLQFVRFLNANRDSPLIHGVNLSLSIRHDVANYACGRTPVCEEAERVVSSGVVVVAAAGNEGYMQLATPSGTSEGYRSISITDPGNAEAVITVGATHRSSPHTYGVSYFSSRGPTGDGRIKPDLVAPGEKITACVPGGDYQVKDGTSMAAPHVSGAAALLMSRHRELIGQPVRIKQILCATATDLGRERYFQGAGMLDVLRALQHV